MGQVDKAMGELDNYVNYLETHRRGELAIVFLEDLLKDHDEQPLLKRVLAARLHHAGRMDEAITMLDALGETLIQSGDKKGAMEVINQIIMMNPPNVSDYRQVLTQLQNS
jgi:hypothetical protein